MQTGAPQQIARPATLAPNADGHSFSVRYDDPVNTTATILLVAWGVIAIALDMTSMSKFEAIGRRYHAGHRALCYAWPLVTIVALIMLMFARVDEAHNDD